MKVEQEKFQAEVHSSFSNHKNGDMETTEVMRQSFGSRMEKKKGANEEEGAYSGRPGGLGRASAEFRPAFQDAAGDFYQGSNGDKDGGGYFHPGHRGNWRMKKLDLLIFQGHNPDG